jgi:two-component system sensor histidine kinase YesM
MNWKAILHVAQGKGSMRTRLIATYALGIVLPLIVVGALFIGSAGNIVEGQLIDMAGASKSHMAERLDLLFQSYSTLVDQYALDRLFMQDMRRNYSAVMDAYGFYTEMWQRQRSNMLAWPNIRNITIYTENPTLVSTVPFLIRTDSGLISPEDFSLVQQAGYRGLWSAVRKVDKRYEYWNPKNDSVENSQIATFAYSRSLKTEGSALGASGMITVEAHDDAILDILSSGIKGMQSVIVNDKNAVISGGVLPDFLKEAPPGVVPGSPEHLQYGENRYIVWHTDLENGWRLVSIVYLDIVTEQARSLRTIALTALGGLAALALGVIWFISNALTKRARVLVEKMHSVDGNVRQLKPIGGNDEISVLDRAFTAMTGRLMESVENQYRAEVRRKEAELELLHTQINPHFLYNMLSSITWLADSRPPEEVRSAVEKLAGYYRITLAKGREIITLREELTGLLAYVELQRLRLGGRIRCLVEADEMLLDTPIPRLTLQPLVENSITHGAGPERRLVSIVITAEVQGDSLLVNVQDDGVGMDAQRLEQLVKGKVESGMGSGLGYGNVAERIRLHFGEAYGLRVRSQVGIGTTVEVMLPLAGASEGHKN